VNIQVYEGERPMTKDPGRTKTMTFWDVLRHCEKVGESWIQICRCWRICWLAVLLLFVRMFS
jgi:hypothetical protein